MKNKVILTACALLAMATAGAQNAYDALVMIRTEQLVLWVWVVQWALWAAICL